MDIDAMRPIPASSSAEKMGDDLATCHDEPVKSRVPYAIKVDGHGAKVTDC